MGVQFFKNIFLALFHLSKGVDHYAALSKKVRKVGRMWGGVIVLGSVLFVCVC